MGWMLSRRHTFATRGKWEEATLWARGSCLLFMFCSPVIACAQCSGALVSSNQLEIKTPTLHRRCLLGIFHWIQWASDQIAHKEKLWSIVNESKELDWTGLQPQKQIECCELKTEGSTGSSCTFLLCKSLISSLGFSGSLVTDFKGRWDSAKWYFGSEPLVHGNYFNSQGRSHDHVQALRYCK